MKKKIAILGSPNLGENHFWKYAEYIWILNESESVKIAMQDFEILWSHYNDSGIGLSEPLFILVIVSSFYFILDKNNRYIVIPFILTGIIWWIRPNGFMMLLIISIIYFIYFRKII